MTPDQYCKDKAAQSGSSFYYSFMFLPADKRRAITALYAFCREVDDVVDESSDDNVARTTLAWWHTEVTAIYTGTPQHPVARALIPVVKQYNLPQAHFHEIIDGMEMDLQQHQYADFKALQQYCYRVASVVGLLAAEIFGYTDRNTLKYAHDLGLAFQLTNIIRDVGEDARRGRIYLPLGELALFGVHVNDILDKKESEGFQKLMQFQIDRAQRYYQRAFEQLPAVDRKTQRTGLIMAAIYRATLEEIVASGCHVLKERVSLTPLRKLWLAWKTWVKN
ncbi:Phytoene synthase [Candidatus Nitrotoga sp. HW29]|uniref:presqualene diphosphate synthase HpnD n=1 Tax=Candidatus Nitrotoga sp. HW29 TaxID=2886963 RepID=UPI001EF204EE|nr:presqualene diphosphate synthase HpnD [Candidatus Nitrotoga sp. HW29]CAH1905881.1 Phytoene synthase [Candidatus Nitrotoga sp. HW29]